MRRNKLVLNLVAGLLLADAAFGWRTSSVAAVITVTNTADAGAGSLRQAIADAQENDAIDFASDVRGTIPLASGQLLISKALTIQGPGANLLALDASGTEERVLRVEALDKAVTISGLTITRGGRFSLESFEGGGIWNNANLTLTACTVSACGLGSGLGGGSKEGGGIYNASGGSLQLIRCTLSGNSVQGGSSFHFGAPGSGHGGALYNAGGAAAFLQICTISNNSAQGGQGSCLGPFGCMIASGRGGGIYNAGGLVMVACTVASNIASLIAPPGDVIGGGGVWNAGTAQITNSIIADNTGEDLPDAVGAFKSEGFNLIGRSDGSTGFTATGDQVGTIQSPIEPLLDSLTDNGGPTYTKALLPGSPAIDAGIRANLTTDQRGRPRTHDDPNIPNAPGSDGTDIGSFEAGAVAVRFGNISTRLNVGMGDNAIIGGFIITGTEPKVVVVRGIGPSIPVPGALADPVIDVYAGSSGQPVATNDNWNDAETRQEIINSGLAPANDLESALWGIINPGPYTVVVRGNNNSTGIGLFEVYDLDGEADSKLANISTRGFVETGNNVMIGGTIILGDASARVLIRAIGPSLSNVGVPNALQDPNLELRDGNGAVVSSNDNWRSDQEAEIIATTIPPTNDLEAAIVATLPTGGAPYTAIVRGVNETTGVALIEAYELN